MNTEEAIKKLIKEKVAQLSPADIKRMAEGIKHVRAKKKRKKKS